MRGKKQKEPVGMNSTEIFAALAMLEKERNIPQTFMMDKIIQAITTAYKRDHEGVENVIVDVDEERHELKMYVQKEVVEEVEFPGTQISLTEAKRLSAKHELGGIVNRTYSAGVLEGDFTLMGQGKLKLSYLSDSAQLVSGDEVLTSGKGGVYPSGLVVGTVDGVFTDPSGINRYAVVTPTAALADLTEVFIITDFDIVE